MILIRISTEPTTMVEIKNLHRMQYYTSRKVEHLTGTFRMLAIHR